MNYQDYLAQFVSYGHLAQVRPFAEVQEGDHAYPLLEVTTPGARTLLITAGFHGDETAGPLTLAERLPEIIDYARARDVALHIFPCLNPSGFVDGTRYNRSGECPNNDFLRYEIAPGQWVAELQPGQHFLRYEVFPDGPKETRALRSALERLPNPAAALDIHQDPWLGSSLAYAYTFGPKQHLRPLVAATDDVVPVAKAMQVDDDDDVWTDEDGLIEFHDGSVTDYFFRRGVPHTAALETTTTAAMDACHDVNLLWIRGFIDLAARD